MCGFVGVASWSRQSNTIWLNSANTSISHRGPDSEGEWWDKSERVGLAHRRLAIVDLSPAGSQPMHSVRYGLTVVFNGEIYNHRELRIELKRMGFSFDSDSDTEVLLVSYAAWGTGCLERLNGMFAFALFDGNRSMILLARDRVGEKPLFYCQEGRTIYFSSELKALFKRPNASRRLNLESLDCYLTMGFVPGDRCIVDGCNKLPPAHAMVFNLNNGETQIWRYWSLPEYNSDVSGEFDEHYLLEELESLLLDSVGRQLIADVPVGILLSGGMDSSLITAMAVRRSNQVRTFSIGFPGQGEYDETIHARLIARHFGTDHLELEARPTSADILPRLAWQFDEPIADSSVVPTWLVNHLVRQHCTVALGGDGGDELFGGYTRYQSLLRMKPWLTRIPIRIRKMIAIGAGYSFPIGLRGRNFLQTFDTDLINSLPVAPGFFDRITRARLMRPFVNHKFVGEDIVQSLIPHQTDLIQRATRMDFGAYLAEDILVKVDRASMLNSVEVRAPLLDYRLVEFAFRQVPSELKATCGDKKILLKRLANRVLPSSFETNRKQGFSVPLHSWLKGGSFRSLFWDVLSSADCIFDARTVGQLMDGQDRGRSNSERLFALAFFELWRTTHEISI